MTFASLSISKEVLIILRLGFVFCSKVILNKKVFFFEDASDKWKRHLGEREIDASEKENKTNIHVGRREGGIRIEEMLKKKSCSFGRKYTEGLQSTQAT